MAEFAAHKSFKASAEIKEIANAKDAQAIARKYERFQQAELTSVTARARSARQWQRFEEEKDQFPNLTWIRTRSATPRELHAGYVGITLPMNHEFWQSNQPGNLWNCKCDWKTTDAPVTNAPGKIAPPARGLEGNPYTTGELITNKHPYYRIGADEAEMIAAETPILIRRLMTKSVLESSLRSITVPQTIIVEGVKVNIKVGFSRAGINHFAHDFHDNPGYKNLLIGELDKVMVKSTFEKSAKSYHIDNEMVPNYHYFSIDILGKTWYLNVREVIGKGQNKYILHSITEYIK
ncbi:MAG: phage head morphogenesis protein [Lentimicrobium sp.]|nr:phage head morphogenesis protein [Lentimicrobium sp.]